MRLGIFGGTFNPIHNCHLKIAEETRKKMGLDWIIFVPSGHPPHKERQTIIDPHHRFEMIRSAVVTHPYFQVSDLEMARPGKSYSIETIQEFKKLYEKAHQLFFIMGLDAFLEITTWKEVERLLVLCNFVVVSRPGYLFEGISRIPFFKLEKDRLSQLDSREIERIEIPLGPGYHLYFLKVMPCKGSSTEVRERIKRGGEIKNLLPIPVESYIMQKRLYL